MSLFMSHIPLYSSQGNSEKVEMICVSLEGSFSEMATDVGLKQKYW